MPEKIKNYVVSEKIGQARVDRRTYLSFFHKSYYTNDQ